MSAHLLFVYGTLRENPRHEMFHRLTRNAASLGQGRVRGRLFSLGSYPGMVLTDDGADLVVGELYEVRAECWQQLVRELDSYEGCAADDTEPHDFRRAIVDVVTPSATTIQAWAYVLNRPTARLAQIPSGDHVAWRASAAGPRP